jgi:hypothetical protein
MLTATKRAIGMPETVIDEYRFEIAGRAGDTPIHESLGERAEMRTRQSLDIPSIGLDELRVATLREGRLICANDREYDTRLMLRF